MISRFVPLSLVAACLLSCSSGDETTVDANVRVGDIRTSDVWKDGTKLTGIVRVVEGVTVEIEPGAHITCAESVQIQIGGTLRVRSAARRASITCPRWRGILVAADGVLDVEGLDIENAEVGVETTKRAGSVRLTDSSVLTSPRPFLVRAESRLELTRVKATTPTTLRDFEKSLSEVYGSLVASYLEYDAGTNEGIMLKDGGEALIEDATLKGTSGLDLVSSYGGKSVTLRYSTFGGAHCGVHMQGIGSFEIDHVTSEDNSFGITIYGASMEGAHVVKNSNLGGVAAWLDLQGDHGPITFENVFVSGSELIKSTDPPKIAKATRRIEGAGPR